MNWVDVVLFLAVIGLAGLAQLYREQRDNLAAYIVFTHPEDFEDEEA